jgi:stage II sporulation protein AA (anti-sigma F factor antagonist)
MNVDEKVGIPELISDEGTNNGEFSVVRLPTEVDLANSSDVLASMLATIIHGGCHLVVDARDVRFLDSSGLNALVRARERTENLGGSMHLVAASRRLRRLLEITQLDQVLHRVDSVDAAVSCLSNETGEHLCGAGSALV